MALFADRISALGTENAFRVGEDIARCVARGMDVVRLNIGEPDFDSAPHINEAAITQIRAGNSHYVDPQGTIGLRTAVADHVLRSRGIDVDPARVVITTGGKPSIGFTMQAYVNPGDDVIYPSPGFPIYESWITYLGARPVPLPLHEATGFTFTADDLARRITPRTKVIILCSPSNPTGGVLTARELGETAEVIRASAPAEVRVYSDEIYEHILFDGVRHHTIAAERGMAARTIIASGHSKGFAMTGWRLGWAVLPSKGEAQLFKQLTINSVSCVPPFIQEAGRTALESPLSAPVSGGDGGGVSGASRLDRACPQRDRGDSVPNAAGGFLRVSERRRRMRATGHRRGVREPLEEDSCDDIPVAAAPDLSARPLRCRDDGPQFVRAYRSGRRAFPPSLDRRQSRAIAGRGSTDS